MTRLKALFVVIFLSVLVISCEMSSLPEAREVELELPSSPDSYNVSGLNDAIPTLGRVLFYDKQLSVNNSVACASCHKQAFAFSDNVAFSRGFENRLTTRSSMPIQNLSFGFFFEDFKIFFQQSLFWDGRVKDLQSLVVRPIVNHVEMGINDLDKLEEKLNAVPYYDDLFTNAFGDDEVTIEKIQFAMSAFMGSIHSNNTRLDRSFFGEELLTPTELEGQNLFFDTYDCNACHQVQNPNGYIQAGTFANIGLDPVYSDDGLENVTGEATDKGKFKIPSLRNVALTAPYMHDGRFKTLNEVLDHYSEQIADHPNLDTRLREPGQGPKRFHISTREKQALIAFLNTLTDYSMIKDPKFSDPFKLK